MISGIVMASGFSRRMGADKLLFEFGERTVVERVIAAAVISELDEVIVVCRDSAVLTIAESLGASAVVNENAQLGQSESIRLGVISANSEANGLMFIAADMPLLESRVIDMLIHEFSMNIESIVVPLYDGVRGNPAIFPASLKEELMSLSGDEGGRAIIEKFSERVIFVETGNSLSGMDIDTKGDFERLKALWKKTNSKPNIYDARKHK
ncbi:MAG: NTP transferase domain-containing protein [Peptoclostridium sp.]|uniref:nucleotidyltransferase family protein n=1 Tax=Peptoclostridium sp. TaxID=1904860 RepID=UPI00139ED9A0|nr:nucleotidyltransferase family protein [Peptoclostridium sp.]MZQ75330.1 NTP transferase domain-containing protein [Peptoclostridium sp.]